LRFLSDDTHTVSVCHITPGRYTRVEIGDNGFSVEKITAREYLRLVKKDIAFVESQMVDDSQYTECDYACIKKRHDNAPPLAATGTEEIRIAVPDSPTPAPAAAPVVPATAPPPAEAAKVETVSPVQPQSTGGESLGDATKRIKQHKACLELAKDNPSIICK
jgi:hypothetical protein